MHGMDKEWVYASRTYSNSLGISYSMHIRYLSFIMLFDPRSYPPIPYPFLIPNLSFSSPQNALVNAPTI